MSTHENLSRRKFIARSGTAAAALAIGAPGIVRAQAVDVVRICAPIELSGPASAFGVVFLNAARLTVDEINKAGGIKSLGGAKVELVVEDTRSDLQRALEAIDKISDQKNLVAAIGPTTSATAVAASVKYEQLKLPYVASALVDDKITESGRSYFFRLSARMNKYVDGVVDFVKGIEQQTGVKHKKVGIVTIDIEPGTIMLKRLQDVFKELGWEYVSETYDFRTTKDFTPMVTRLRSAGVDLVVGQQFPLDAVLFAKATQQLDYNPIAFVWAIGGHYLNSFVASAGKAGELIFDNSFTAPADTSPETKRLNALYLEQFKEPLTGYAGFAPASIGVIVDAVERAGKIDTKAVRDAIAATVIPHGGKYMTIPGGVKFNDKNDNAQANGAMIQIVEGKQYTVWPPDQAVRPPVWPRPAWSKI